MTETIQQFRASSVTVLCAMLSLIALLGGSACTSSAAGTETVGPAAGIQLESLALFGEMERPVVLFDHDRHTGTLGKQGKGCDTCHLAVKDDELSPLFGRLLTEDRETVMEIYHDRCIGCHQVENEAGNTSGPTICGECHLREDRPVVARVPMGFDLALHQRHVEAAESKCDGCHHLYDAEQKKLVYQKGQENPCRDCHRLESVENRESFRIVSHRACIGCHRRKTADGEKKSGPQTCGGCHGCDALKSFERPDEIRRLERGQADKILLRVSDEDLKKSKLNTVPFNHQLHEQANDTCRVCHHESLKSCKSCHRLESGDQGIKLERAMHDSTAAHSCVGCHESLKFEPACAGCHTLMEKGRLGESACRRCHYGPRPDSAVLAEQSTEEILSGLPATAGNSGQLLESLDIPEEVTIGNLADRFEPAIFPHRKVVEKLMEGVSNSRLAGHFHGGPDALCMGCHHHTPEVDPPPYCQSCHGEPFNDLNLFMPGLYGAYHQLCLGCHQAMGIEKNVSGCTDCHAERMTVAPQPQPSAGISGGS